MRILIVSDEESRSLWDHYSPGKLDNIDLILSAGDMKAEYLSFLVTMANCPLLYGHGNHDASYDQNPPEGCECIDDRIITVNGLRIMGLGGCKPYNGGPYQYSESAMRKRIRKLKPSLFFNKGVDIVLTHAAVKGYGDLEDAAHQGFEAFIPLLEKYKPKYLIHGHIHDRYHFGRSREYDFGSTKIINGNGVYYLDVPTE